MAIDRTQYNALVNDSGGPVPDGTFWTKTKVKDVILDPIDALVAEWVSYTPSWTNGTLGNGVISGKSITINKITFFKINLVWGTTTSASAGLGWRFGLPVTAVSGGTSGSLSIGMGEAIDISATRSYQLRGRLHSTNTEVLIFSGDGASSGQLTDTAPFTWANADELHLSGWVEIP